MPAKIRFPEGMDSPCEYNNGKDHWDEDFKKKNTTTADKW